SLGTECGRNSGASQCDRRGQTCRPAAHNDHFEPRNCHARLAAVWPICASEMEPKLPPLVQARAFAVHVFTAAGAALALAALIYATDAQWSAMFLCFGAALIVDAVGGTFPSSLKLAEVLPRWSR